MSDPEISVVIRACNEWPLIAATVLSYIDDLESSNISHEIVVATNCCTDRTPDIFHDRFRRLVQNGTLKVVEYNERPSHWQAANAGIRASCGKFVVISDAHMSVHPGTMSLLRDGVAENGGIWHPAEISLNDTTCVTYHYDERIRDRFWGFRCRHRLSDDPYPIAMAPHCCLMVSRAQLDEFGSYLPCLKTYGGGEPYLSLLWWMMGSGVWMHPDALVRHCFGWRPTWVTAKKDAELKRSVYKRGGEISKSISLGDEYLTYGKGYTRNNDDFSFNFLAAGYVLGGIKWLDHLLGRLSVGDKVEMRRSVIRAGSERHAKIRNAAKITLDELMDNPPWCVCDKHPADNTRMGV